MRFRVSTSYCRRWDHLSPGRRAVRKYYNTGRKKINQFFQTGIDLGKAAIIGVSPKRKINTYPPLFNRLRYEVRTGAGFFSLLNQWFKTTRLISCMIEADEKNLEGQAGDGMVKISKEETGKRIRRLLAESGITVRDVQEELELDSPQSVYKWLKGKALPSLDNLLVLGCMLDLPVEQLLVLEGKEDEEIVPRRKRWVKKRPHILCAYVLRTHRNLERIQMILSDTRTDWKPEKRSGIWKEAPEPENGRNSFNPEAPRR